MSLQIGKAIYNILSTDERVVEKVDNKIYPLVADNGTTFPFIVYKRVSIIPASTKDRYIYQEMATVEVVVASDKYNESIEIADSVKEALQGKKGVFDGINVSKIEFSDASEDFIEDTFTQNITFKTYINN